MQNHPWAPVVVFCGDWPVLVQSGDGAVAVRNARGVQWLGSVQGNGGHGGLWTEEGEASLFIGHFWRKPSKKTAGARLAAQRFLYL